jgi:hypothetical protein
MFEQRTMLPKGGFSRSLSPRHLPADILRYMIDFLDEFEARLVMNICKYFRASLYGFVGLTLTKMGSLKLYDGSDSVVAKKVMDSSNRTTIKLMRCNNITDVNVFSRAHTLIIKDCPNITNVKCLDSVRVLELQSMNVVSGLGALKNMHELTLCNIDGSIDCHEINHVHTLVLDECHEITNIDALGEGSIVNLTLRRCQNVVDVSGLGSVRNITIESCQNIINIDALDDIDNLTLDRCSGIMDISHIKNIGAVTVNNGNDITHTSVVHDTDVLNIDIDEKFYTANIFFRLGCSVFKNRDVVSKISCSQLDNVTKLGITYTKLKDITMMDIEDGLLDSILYEPHNRYCKVITLKHGDTVEDIWNSIGVSDFVKEHYIGNLGKMFASNITELSRKKGMVCV